MKSDIVHEGKALTEFQRGLEAAAQELERMARFGSGEERGMVPNMAIGLEIYSGWAHLIAQQKAIRSLGQSNGQTERLIQLRVRIAENCTNVEALNTLDSILSVPAAPSLKTASLAELENANELHADPSTVGADLPLDWNHFPADPQEGWEMLCRAKVKYDALSLVAMKYLRQIESAERRLAERDWILVADGLPMPYQLVLVTDGTFSDVCCWKNDSWEWRVKDRPKWTTNFHPTHWMQLPDRPAAPREPQGEDRG